MASDPSSRKAIVSMSTCPSHATLARLGHDSFDGAEWAAVEAHVQHCEHCVGMLEKLVGHDTATAPAPATLPAEENLPHIPGFDIEGELGRGGMGVVYRAWESKLARTVALKIVPSGPMTGARERRRWLSEARCVTRVNHPNIVQIHDAAEADGWLYLVLEFVPGGSLKERLCGPVPPRAAAQLMRPVAAAVTAVHAAGLLHLDLKPSNILLDSPPESAWNEASPKVADFGIARPLADPDASATRSAGPWGTPFYMAPEQIAADRGVLGPATDVYALGAILYELVTGRPPFLAASPIETFDQIREAEPTSPRNLNPSVPRDLDTICVRCLHKDPRRRYPSAQALANDLDHFLEGRPIQARPVSLIEHAWRWCRRQPVIASLAATLFLTVIGSFLGLLTLLRRSDDLRAHSEADFRVASRLLDEIVRILSDSRIYNPSLKLGQELERTLEIARAQEVELSKRHLPDVGDLKRLATIDGYLAQVSLGNGKQDQARSLMEESIGCCDAYLAHSPTDLQIHAQLFGAVNWMAMTYHADLKNDRLYKHWHARAIRTLERLKSLPEAHVQGMFEVSRWQRQHATSLLLAGALERARRELERDLDFIRSVPVAEIASPEFVLSEALTLAALGRWSGEFPPLRSSIQPQPANVVFQDLEGDLAELTARRLGWLPPTAKPPGLVPEDLSTEAWVDRVLSSIKTDAAIFHLDPTRIPTIGWRMWRACASTLAWQRRAGKLGDAHRIADRLLALAERLTRAHPDRAVAYMLLSEAYVQKAKNAYREDEAPVIARWERQALEAAIRAATLQPEADEARRLVNDRRARLDKIAPKS